MRALVLFLALALSQVCLAGGPAPTVTAVSPTSGPAAGGTVVTITGTVFVNVTLVNFGATPAATFTVNSSTSITATAPSAAGTVDVTVATNNGTSATSAADQFTFVAAPTISSVNPSTGPTTGGTAVTITGTGLTGTTAVNFGATPTQSFTVNSDTSISTVSPPGAVGIVDVTATTAAGTSVTGELDQFTYSLLPVTLQSFEVK